MFTEQVKACKQSKEFLDFIQTVKKSPCSSNFMYTYTGQDSSTVLRQCLRSKGFTIKKETQCADKTCVKISVELEDHSFLIMNNPSELENIVNHSFFLI